MGKLYVSADDSRSEVYGGFILAVSTTSFSVRAQLTGGYIDRRPPLPPVSGQQHQKFKLPLLGGKVTVSIVETHGPPQAGPGPERTPKSRMFAKLQRKAKLGNSRPSDEVEGLRFEVKWQPEKGALGVIPSPDQLVLPEGLLQVVSS